jgi:hypothetical protein
MKNKHYDLIGDIHGHHDKLTALLTKLGYRPHGESFRHPHTRKANNEQCYLRRPTRTQIFGLKSYGYLVETSTLIIRQRQADLLHP